MDLEQKRDFFFDLDRTLINWDETVLGAEDLVHTLREKDRNVYFFTDNSLLSREKYAEKLRRLDIPAEKDDILTVNYVAGKVFSQRGINSVYTIGSKHLINSLENHGINTRGSANNVLLGFDRQFNYNKIKRAREVLKEGGKLYTCSNEKVFHVGEKQIPHQKALNNCVKTFAEEKPKLLGIPSDEYLNTFTDYFPHVAERSLLVGDRLADIELGNRMGMETAAVTSGEIDRKQLSDAETLQKPDYGISNLTKLTRKINRL